MYSFFHEMISLDDTNLQHEFYIFRVEIMQHCVFKGTNETVQMKQGVSPICGQSFSILLKHFLFILRMLFSYSILIQDFYIYFFHILFLV